MSNRLAAETSPYLLQHAENPVDWYPWGPEALEKARKEDKPIFLSIGYAACHWCHVMAHESFEDPQIADLLNQNFVNIKVDREERPDIDSIYMSAVVAMTGQGGWPMSLFLTPEGKPFYAGTYFPPSPRHGLPSFRQLIEGISAAWTGDRRQVDEVGQNVAEHLRQSNQVSLEAGTIRPDLLQKINLSLEQNYDKQHGGWGAAPKFPQPMVIEYLLTQTSRGDPSSARMVTDALKKMSRGGMYDLVGGGFHRYSTDDEWLVPHFEKMLYDNAQLALVYLHAFLLTGDPDLRQVCEETLDFIGQEMTHPQGGFFSSLDADSEGEEGKFYTWTYPELKSLLPDPIDFELASSAFELDPLGNFEGKIVLQKTQTIDQIAQTSGMPLEQVKERLKNIKNHLFQERSKRIRPQTDDKILVSWNALALSAFAEAGRYLGRSDYLEMATRNARFLLSELFHAGQLARAWRNGRARHSAYLEDYAGMAVALLTLYQADPDPAWFQSARDLVFQIQAHFQDPSGGFFDTHAEQEPLLLRPKDIQDNAIPSGNALAVRALLLLSAYTGQFDLSEQANLILSSLQNALTQYPTAFGAWLSALDLAIGPLQEVAVLGDPADPGYSKLVESLNQTYRPRCVVAFSQVPPPSTAPDLVQNRPLHNNQATAYVCEGFICLLPVNSPAEMLAQLK